MYFKPFLVLLFGFLLATPAKKPIFNGPNRKSPDCKTIVFSYIPYLWMFRTGVPPLRLTAMDGRDAYPGFPQTANGLAFSATQFGKQRHLCMPRRQYSATYFNDAAGRHG